MWIVRVLLSTVKSSQGKSSQVKSSQVKSDQVRSGQVRSGGWRSCGNQARWSDPPSENPVGWCHGVPYGQMGSGGPRGLQRGGALSGSRRPLVLLTSPYVIGGLGGDDGAV